MTALMLAAPSLVMLAVLLLVARRRLGAAWHRRERRREVAAEAEHERLTSWLPELAPPKARLVRVPGGDTRVVPGVVSPARHRRVAQPF